MAEKIREDKTARHLDHLSEALDSGTQHQVHHLLKNLSAAEIGDLLDPFPKTFELDRHMRQLGLLLALVVIVGILLALLFVVVAIFVEYLEPL